MSTHSHYERNRVLTCAYPTAVPSCDESIKQRAEQYTKIKDGRTESSKEIRAILPNLPIVEFYQSQHPRSLAYRNFLVNKTHELCRASGATKNNKIHSAGEQQSPVIDRYHTIQPFIASPWTFLGQKLSLSISFFAEFPWIFSFALYCAWKSSQQGLLYLAFGFFSKY